MSKQLIALYYRTGVEAFLVLLRGDTLYWAKPHIFQTSDVFEDYFQMSFSTELGDWVQRLECYKLGKVTGALASFPFTCAADYCDSAVKQKAEADQAELRKRLSAIVLSNLRTFSAMLHNVPTRLIHIYHGRGCRTPQYNREDELLEL